VTNTSHIVWSFGGGVQSVRILTLIAENKLSKPYRTIMVDTGRERQLVWDYTNAYTIPLMRQLGIELEIVSQKYAKNGLYGHKGNLLLPAFTEHGKLQTFCSGEWKRRVSERYLIETGGYTYKAPITQWFGMSLDEIERMRVSDLKWTKYHYPLVFDVPQRRHECILGIERFGLPKPPKSACWMCPNLSDDEWIEEKELTPNDFSKAVDLDFEIREQDKRNGHSGVWLHKDCVPLDEVIFRLREETPMEQLCASTCWT
jgi:hypothetical protein